MARKIPAKEIGNKQRKGSRRGLRTDSEGELWENVRAECKSHFLAMTGRSWDPTLVTMKPADPRETEAREVYSRLRSAVKEAAAFVERLDVKKQRPQGLATIVLWSFVPALLRQNWLSKTPWERPLEPRAQLVVSLDTYDFFGLPPHANGCGRFLTIREMAVISLLMGNKPSLKSGTLNFTPADVIKREASYIRPLLKRYCANVLPQNRGAPGASDEGGEGSE